MVLHLSCCAHVMHMYVARAAWAGASARTQHIRVQMPGRVNPAQDVYVAR
jgi:hypothetical protein